jgi:membrane protein implicated in regulation of membrane protease activity
MAESTIWWLLAGTAIGVELVTGTFYLLMVALGLAAAALAAHAGMSLTAQIVIAALVCASTVLVWRRFKQSQPADVNYSANRDVNMDVGETVNVETWNPDGTSSVRYRGANWAVSSVSGGPLATGPHQVVEVVGSRLMVRKL